MINKAGVAIGAGRAISEINGVVHLIRALEPWLHFWATTILWVALVDAHCTRVAIIAGDFFSPLHVTVARCDVAHTEGVAGVLVAVGVNFAAAFMVLSNYELLLLLIAVDSLAGTYFGNTLFRHMMTLFDAIFKCTEVGGTKVTIMTRPFATFCSTIGES